MKKVLVICGPTASGKSELALECARMLNSEIISADSLCVYKKLNVGTAKPSEREMLEIKHHMINVVNPNSTYSVGDYKEMALPILKSLLNKGKVPIVCGGTGFYINSLLFNYSYGKNPANLELRNYYKKLADEKGNEYVYDILKEKDYVSYEKINCNDIKRVIRALEICDSGIKKSELNDDKLPLFEYEAYSYDYCRDDLYKRIDDRVDKMLENGLVEEVKSLVREGLNESSQALQGIGYKEILPFLKGETDLSAVKEKIKLNTRHYAKRQITFFKKLPNIKYISPKENVQITAKRIVNELCLTKE